MGNISSAWTRLWTLIGNALWKRTNTVAINQAIIETGIRDAKAKADKAHYSNGQLQGQIIRLKEQVKRQEQQKFEIESMLSVAASQNNEQQGALYADQLASLEQDLRDNQEQLKMLEDSYKQNTEIIANSLREIRKFELDFQRTKTKVAIGQQMESLAGLMKSSISELQGMVGGEMGQAMDELKNVAASGQGQMIATLDLAKEMGANIRMKQEAKMERGKMLFKEWQAKHGHVQAEASPTTSEVKPKEKQKIATA